MKVGQFSGEGARHRGLCEERTCGGQQDQSGERLAPSPSLRYSGKRPFGVMTKRTQSPPSSDRSVAVRRGRARRRESPEVPEPPVATQRGKTTFERPIDPREKISVILRHFLKACVTFSAYQRLPMPAARLLGAASLKGTSNHRIDRLKRRHFLSEEPALGEAKE